MSHHVTGTFKNELGLQVKSGYIRGITSYETSTKKSAGDDLEVRKLSAHSSLVD